MQTLRNDELFLLAIDLSLPDLLNFCSSSKQINLSVCNNDRFWLQKLNKDFPGWNTITNVRKSFLGFSYETSLKDPKFSKRFNQLKSNKDKYVLFYNTKNFSILKEKLHLKEDINDIFNLRVIDAHGLYYSPESILYEIPKEIGILTNLRKLALYGNKITAIPKEIGKLINLRELLLNSNKIEEVPKEIGNLLHLEALTLHHNLIEILPKEIGDLVKLEHLNLSDNPLIEIPKEIGNLTFLEDLQLSETLISEIPLEIGNLTKLKLLNLNRTNVNTLPDEVINLKLKYRKVRIILHNKDILL